MKIKIYVWSFFLLFAILALMSVDTWGTLPKAQDDPTTIDQAIDLKIAAHLGDPSAHLSSGASLANHKSNAVIDHPQSSVLADKATTSEFDFSTYFESLMPWSTSGDVDNVGVLGVFMNSSNDDGDYAPVKLNTMPTLASAYLDWTKNTLVEAVVAEELWNEHYSFFFGWATYHNDTQISGIGFQVKNNVIKGFLGFGTSYQFTAAIGSGVHNTQNLRVLWDATAKVATFYINGEVAATLSQPSATGYENFTLPRLELYDSVAYGSQFGISMFHLAQTL